MIMALGAQSAMAWAGCILLLWHNMIVKPALFIAGDEARQIYGTDDVRSMVGLIKLAPLIAMVFFLQAMSLAGIPPLSGFWGKLVLFMQGAELGHLALIFATILGGFLTLMSMLKIWIAVFWGEPTTSTTQGQFKTTPASVTFLVIALLMGLGAYYFSQSAVDAAESVKDFLSYYQAVIELPVKGARL
jgi:multicomponent Na+:H+ antiporter subunit D